MSESTDQFFTEGDEREAAPTASDAPKGAKDAGGIKPPTFGMAVAIAAVALVLGFGIGYFVGMYIASNATSTTAAATTTAAVAVQSTESESTESEDASDTSDEGSETSESSLPEGHPDLSQFMNEDGSINEEALAQYKADKAAADAEASSETSDTAGQGSEESATTTTTE